MPDGDNCICGAYGESECGCPDADWRCGDCLCKDIEIEDLKNLIRAALKWGLGNTQGRHGWDMVKAAETERYMIAAVKD